MGALVILGAGGASREILDIVAALNAEGRDRVPITVVCVYDDDASRQGGMLHGIPIRGAIAAAVEHDDATFIIGIASSRNRTVRRAVATRLGLPAKRFATLIDPRTAVSRSVTVRPGSVVSPTVVIGPEASLGEHVFVAPGVMIDAEVQVEDGAVLSPLATVGREARIGASAYVGAGAVVGAGISIGAGALVGMGAVVTADVPPGLTVVGNPARPL